MKPIRGCVSHHMSLLGLGLLCTFGSLHVAWCRPSRVNELLESAQFEEDEAFAMGSQISARGAGESFGDGPHDLYFEGFDSVDNNIQIVQYETMHDYDTHKLQVKLPRREFAVVVKGSRFAFKSSQGPDQLVTIVLGLKMLPEQISQLDLPAGCLPKVRHTTTREANAKRSMLIAVCGAGVDSFTMSDLGSKLPFLRVQNLKGIGFVWHDEHFFGLTFGVANHARDGVSDRAVVSLMEAETAEMARSGGLLLTFDTSKDPPQLEITPTRIKLDGKLRASWKRDIGGIIEASVGLEVDHLEIQKREDGTIHMPLKHNIELSMAPSFRSQQEALLLHRDPIVAPLGSERQLEEDDDDDEEDGETGTNSDGQGDDRGNGLSGSTNGGEGMSGEEGGLWKTLGNYTMGGIDAFVNTTKNVYNHGTVNTYVKILTEGYLKEYILKLFVAVSRSADRSSGSGEDHDRVVAKEDEIEGCSSFLRVLGKSGVAEPMIGSLVGFKMHTEGRIQLDVQFARGDIEIQSEHRIVEKCEEQTNEGVAALFAGECKKVCKPITPSCESQTLTIRNNHVLPLEVGIDRSGDKLGLQLSLSQKVEGWKGDVRIGFRKSSEPCTEFFEIAAQRFFPRVIYKKLQGKRSFYISLDTINERVGGAIVGPVRGIGLAEGYRLNAERTISFYVDGVQASLDVGGLVIEEGAKNNSDWTKSYVAVSKDAGHSALVTFNRNDEIKGVMDHQAEQNGKSMWEKVADNITSGITNLVDKKAALDDGCYDKADRQQDLLPACQCKIDAHSREVEIEPLTTMAWTVKQLVITGMIPYLVKGLLGLFFDLGALDGSHETEILCNVLSLVYKQWTGL